MALPHPSIIRRWYSTIDGNPGFTEEAFTALQAQVQDEKNKQKNVFCSLMIDEMAIRKHVQWSGKKFTGYVDIGIDAEPDDTTAVASEALVLMVVALNGH